MFKSIQARKKEKKSHYFCNQTSSLQDVLGVFKQHLFLSYTELLVSGSRLSHLRLLLTCATSPELRTRLQRKENVQQKWCQSWVKQLPKVNS